MWQSLANFADAELETGAEAAKTSYAKLAIATWELQKHVKELLCEYPGPAAAEPAIDEPMGREGDAMGHAARLLSSLCAQPARGDVTSAPGAIYTPKGDARQRAPTDAGPSVFEGASAMKAFLSADVPSMRWDGAAASSGADAGGRLRQLSPTPGCGLLSGQRPTPKLLHVRVDTDMDADAQGTLQRQSDELRAWALAALGGLHPDASLEDVHGALLRDAVQCGALPQYADWFRLCVDADVMARSRQLLAGVFHTSRSSQEAWAGLTRAFAHGLVQPDGEAARMLGEYPSGEASGFRTFGVTPESYQSYIKDLQDKMDELVGELFRDSPEDSGSPRADRSLSEKDVAAYRLGITPRTYLQVIGQKLLYHAALQIPCMAELPERIPHWALRYLYGRPFAEAVRLALQHGVASISDAFGPSGEGPDARVRGGQLAQSLLQSSAGHKDVNPNKADPRQQPRRERADGARARFSFSGVGTSAQRAPPSETDGGGSGGATAATAKVDACQRALCAARSAVDLLIGIERDVKGFEEGFAALLRGGACGPLRPEKLAQLMQAPVPPLTAAACLSVVREEVARVLREMGPTLRTFLCGSVAAFVQACLAGDDLQTQSQQPCPVPVCAGVWPSLEEDARRPSLAVSGAQDSLQHRSSSSLISSPRGGGAAAAQTATASDRGDASAFVRSCDARKGGERGDDPHAPPAVDALSHRVLEFVSWMSGCLGQLPEPLQPMLFGAILDCLALLMDQLSLICTALRDMPGSGGGGGGGARPLPLSLAFMFHSAACCARRRLEALRPWKGLGAAAVAAAVATARQLQDGQSQPHLHMELVQQHGEALLQADELVTSIHQYIVMSYMQAVYGVVLSSLDRTDWCAFRPEVMRGQSAGPAVRVWHSMMLRMLHTAALHASPHAAEWIVGQVLLESVSCMAQRYLQACPTVQMLREFVADAVHLAASVFLLAQPIRVSGRLRRGGNGGGGRQAAQEPPPQRQDSATDGGANTAVLWLRVPFPMARALAEAAREVLTRAALLHLPGAQLAEIARKAGLLAAATGGMGSVEPNAAAEQPLPGFSEPMPPPAPAAEQLPAPIDIGGTPGSATGSGVKLAPLPAIHSQRSALPTEADANARSGLGSGSPLPVAAASPPTTAASVGRDRSRSTAGEAAAFDAARSEPSAPAATADPLSGAACVAATDAERLDLFSSWLTGEVVRAMTDIAEAIELVGGSRLVARQLLIPLGDRMADPAEQAGPEGQQGLKAAGSMWRSCLEQLAQRASTEQVVLALARRHELHAAVGTEPPGNAESRRVVRALARLLGLLPGRPEEDG